MNLAEDIAGAFLVLLAGVDLFLTVFNYDGFTFLAGRYQGFVWRLTILVTAALPPRPRRAARSLGSAMLVPATVALWLGLEISGFALIYQSGLVSHGLHPTQRLAPGFGSAFYFSAGVISTLAFGDLVPHGAVYQAVTDLQAITGLATFTLALGYVVTAFGVLGNLDTLHNTVTRHARDPERPSSILARHYRGGAPAELTDLLQALSDQLEAYDNGLRRYPVVFYFHTRRVARSVPRVFSTLGSLLAHIRWGLPADDAMADDPWLVVLLEQYASTMSRLQRSFVGPREAEPPPIPTAEEFGAAYRRGSGDDSVVAFRALQDRTRAATGLPADPDEDADRAYERFREWFFFHHRNAAVLDRVSRRLGYGREPMVGATAPGPANAPAAG